MTIRRANAAWARTAVQALVANGVTDLILAPGSRSTPLVLAAATEPRVRILPHLDERSAGFLALGIGKGSGRPAAVLTTSGTAVANLFPAVVEAYQSGAPLLLLTADRPPELRGTDANQTIDQERIFGSYAVGFFDAGMPDEDEAALEDLRTLVGEAVALALRPPGGPVHLNFPFAKPLEPERESSGGGAAGDPEALPVEPTVESTVELGAEPGVEPTPLERTPGGTEFVRSVAALTEQIRAARHPLIVLGPSVEYDSARRLRTATGAVTLAARIGAPLLPDPLSGARHGERSNASRIGRFDLFLRDARVREGLKPDLILRIGPTPTSASLARYLEVHDDVPQVLLGTGRRSHDHLSVASHWLPDDPGPLLHRAAERLAGTADGSSPDPAWAERWREIDAATGHVVTSFMDDVRFEGAIMDRVVEATPLGAALFVSSSMPVRDADSYGPPRADALDLFGNRGASGIDGIVSTALGVALADGGRPVVAVLGDIAMIHDGNGLLPLHRLQPDLTLVVIHNDGGGIFHMLPIREFEPAFSPYFATPHGIDFQPLAEMHRIPYHRVNTLDALRTIIAGTERGSGPRVVEIRTDREYNRTVREQVVNVVERALSESVAPPEGIRED